ncbi:hypothetical protein BDZ91DRAFT_800702 [Kalaharituber pfeilii]|nr:hypothetical protein BDZ91DRAFT_800702 [Kalaharituber pfeilii]
MAGLTGLNLIPPQIYPMAWFRTIVQAIANPCEGGGGGISGQRWAVTGGQEEELAVWEFDTGQTYIYVLLAIEQKMQPSESDSARSDWPRTLQPTIAFSPLSQLLPPQKDSPPPHPPTAPSKIHTLVIDDGSLRFELTHRIAAHIEKYLATVGMEDTTYELPLRSTVKISNRDGSGGRKVELGWGVKLDEQGLVALKVQSEGDGKKETVLAVSGVASCRVRVGCGGVGLWG